MQGSDLIGKKLVAIVKDAQGIPCEIGAEFLIISSSGCKRVGRDDGTWTWSIKSVKEVNPDKTYTNICWSIRELGSEDYPIF